ncbi:MAG: SWIM zinc finger family protein [Bacteroidota bacterium]
MRFSYKYAGHSQINGSARQTSMSFVPDALRDPTFFVGDLNQKIPFREAMSALHDVVVSDLRFKPKDKTAYKTWLKQQEDIWLANAMAGKADVQARLKNIQEELKVVRGQKDKLMAPFYRARQQYFDYIYQRDRAAWYVLDPVITVHPDELFFECFSEDESTYARLGCNYNVFSHINEFACGTTNIDYSQSLYDEFQKIRTYKDTHFKIDPGGFEVATTGEDQYREVKIDLPDSWVRGFLQVSSAMTLPGHTLDLHPMDLYSICLFLRQHKARRSPRSMRFVLEPGQPIQIIFEPWNHVITCHRSIYQGSDSAEIRVWGRRRLLVLERLIPIAQHVRIHLLGTGLPSFYSVDLGDMHFMLGLSGWTSNDWSRMGHFDLMAPRKEVGYGIKQKVIQSMTQQYVSSVSALSNDLNIPADQVEAALTAFTQAGRVMYDLNQQVYRLRELSQEPLKMETLRFADEREQEANTIIDSGKLRVKKSVDLMGNQLLEGVVRYSGKYWESSIKLDAEQRMTDGSCTCGYYIQNKLHRGPCPHMLALRIKHQKNQKPFFHLQ